MKLNFSRKKVVFGFCFIFIIISLMAGFYFWAKNKEVGTLIYAGIKYSDILNYEIKDISDGKMIENKEEGLIFKVPENWTVQKVKTEDQSEISLFDQDCEFDEKGDLNVEKSFKEKGACGIGIAVIKSKKISSDISTDADISSNYIKALQLDPNWGDNSGFSLDMVSNKIGLRQIVGEKDGVKMIYVRIPINQTIYAFSTGYIFNNSNKCIERFDDFLKTILINK
ncbi:MAG: hypothetical protein NTW46_02040 [Candidatus Nealsonbacteria bacterium]|nr:hypothetical protein [Candidatus Nealsonbacteria bacterium]